LAKMLTLCIIGASSILLSLTRIFAG
jgi:hypothetical protein